MDWIALLPQPKAGHAAWADDTTARVRLIATGLTAGLLLGCAQLPPEAKVSQGRNAVLLAGEEWGFGARVLAFARAHLGRVVGGGECAELADQALIAAGARSFGAYAGLTEGDDYVWGRKVSLRDARPGDILQFRDFVAETSTRSRGGESDASDERPHHTAILEAILGDTLLVLEQNATPDRSVQRNRVSIRTRTYVGMPTPDAVTTVQVTGTISVFRPEAAGAV